MSFSVIDEPQRKAARVAGFTFLFAMAIVILANYGINFRLIVPGNAVETARNIMAHETLFRLNIVCNLIYVLTIVAMVAAVYVTLKPVHRNLALVAAFSRLVFAGMWGVTALNSLGALRLLGDTAYLQAFGVDQLRSLARLNIASSYDAYYIGLPFWGLASTVCSYLWFKSAYIPRALSAFGVVSSAWCVICAFAYLIFPDFANTVGLSWFDIPLVLFELGTGYWLLFKGLRPSQIAGPHRARDGQ
jgi:hypothetical protein